MNALLERLGGFVTRHRWTVIALWLVLLAGVTIANRAVNANFVNDYTVPGSQSSKGLDLLRSDFASAGGYSGQIVFHAEKKTVADQSKAVATTVKNLAALPHVISATDPLTVDKTPAVSKDGTIAYASVSWSVAPASLDEDYLDKLDDAVKPARSAGLTVEYGGGAGQIGQVARRRALRGDRPRRGAAAPAHHVRRPGGRARAPRRGGVQCRGRARGGRPPRRPHQPAHDRGYRRDAARSGRGRGLRAVPGRATSRTARARHGDGPVGRAHRRRLLARP